MAFLQIGELLPSWRSSVVYLLTLFLAWIMYRILRERYSPLSKIPGPPGLPIIGNMLVFLRRKDHINLMREWTEKYGNVFKHNPGWGRTRINVTGPNNLKQVLVTNRHKYDKSRTIKLVVPSIGDGILSCSDKDHVRQFRVVSPAFSYSNLKGMVREFKEKADNLVKVWKRVLSKSTNDDVCVETDLSHTTLDIIGQCAFGYDFDTILSGKSEISKAFTSLIEGSSLKQLLLRAFIPLYKYFDKDQDKARHTADEKVLEVIHEKMKHKERGIESTDLLDLLLENYSKEDSKINEEELRSQVFTILLAGHETTSASMAWTLLELARNPEIQEKVRQEVNGTLQNDSDVNWSKLNDLKYLASVIKESLRLHSPVYHVSRVVIEDDIIGGYHIPKGSLVVLGIQSTHILPQYWKDPDVFNPDRFLDKGDGEPAVEPYTFLPFSLGTRSCIGSKFAIAEMKTVLSLLLKNFTFTECPGFEVQPLIRITVRPNPPLWLRISDAKKSS